MKLTDPKFRNNVYATLLSNFLLMLLLFMVCRLLFFVFNRNLFPDMSASQIWPIFVGGLRFDLSALAWGNIIYIVLFIIPFKFRYHRYYQRALKYLFVVINSILLMANCCDFIYFRFTLRRTTSGVFQEFAKEQNYFSLITHILVDYWYVALIWLALIWLLVWRYRKAQKPKLNFSLKGNVLFYAVSTGMLALVLALCVLAMRGGFEWRPIAPNHAGKYVKKPLEASIVQNTPFCIFRTLQKKSQILSPIHYFSDDEELSSLYNPIITPAPKEKFDSMNVVVIVWESFGREYVGALNADLDNGSYKGYTPFIDSLIGHSFTFTSAYANGRKSVDALPSILSSLPETGYSYSFSLYSSNIINSLGSLLKTKGYNTSFFHGGINGTMGFNAFVSLAGFDKYYGKDEYNNNKDFDGVWGIWDEEFLQFFAQKLNTTPQPFCSAVFTLSSHHPFKLPKKHAQKFSEGPHAITKCISYTDYALQRFFETAQTQDWYNNTLFVITADHANHPLHPEYETSVGQMSVPIIYFTPNGKLRGMLSHVTQQTDIMPTVLSLLNFDESYIAFGQNALDTTQEHFAINYLNGIYQIFYLDYVLLFDGTQSTGLYNLKADRLLQNNCIAEQPEIAKKMELKGKAFIQQYNNRLITNRLTVPSANDKK